MESTSQGIGTQSAVSPRPSQGQSAPVAGIVMSRSPASSSVPEPTAPRPTATAEAVKLEIATELYSLWMDLGGTAHWRDSISPADLTVMVLQCPLEKIDVYGTPTRRAVLPCGTVEVSDEELPGFVSNVLARLPRLRKLRFHHCAVWPFDWEACANLPALREIRVFYRTTCSPWERDVKALSAFCRVESVTLDAVPWSAELVHEMALHLPALTDPKPLEKGSRGIVLHRVDGPVMRASDERELKVKCHKKIQFMN